jgi:hypothetical protein
MIGMSWRYPSVYIHKISYKKKQWRPPSKKRKKYKPEEREGMP